jgi:hypothetical protein
MHTLEPELRTLHAEGSIDDATAARALAADTGRVFSVHAELRAVLYAGVLLVMSGLGIVLARNLERIGPLAIVTGLALAAAACGTPAWRARRAGRPLTVAAEYLLLLAVLHGALAYAFASPLLLAASLAALAGWFGVGGSFGDALQLSTSTPALGARALACAAVIVAWRGIDRRRREDSSFGAVFEHFAANLAFWGAIAWCLEWPWLAAGLPLLAALTVVSVRNGLAAGREAFLVYGVVYAAIGLCAAVLPRLHGTTPSLVFMLLVVCVAAASLWGLRRRLKESGS